MNELDSISYAILFCKSDKKISKNLLRISEKKYLKFILELILNHLAGNFNVTSEQVQKESHKHRRSFIKLLDKRSSLNTRKRILYKLKDHIGQIIIPFLLQKIKNE